VELGLSLIINFKFLGLRLFRYPRGLDGYGEWLSEREHLPSTLGKLKILIIYFSADFETGSMRCWQCLRRRSPNKKLKSL
jgi:hypothetical protein